MKKERCSVSTWHKRDEINSPVKSFFFQERPFLLSSSLFPCQEIVDGSRGRRKDRRKRTHSGIDSQEKKLYKPADSIDFHSFFSLDFWTNYLIPCKSWHTDERASLRPRAVFCMTSLMMSLSNVLGQWLPWFSMRIRCDEWVSEWVRDKKERGDLMYGDND